MQQKFPDRPVVLILSEKYLRSFKHLTVEIITEESIPVNTLHFDFEAIQKNWSGLQKSYWTNTTKRFFVLNRYMEAKNLERIIHLESDCVLLNDSWLNQEFENEIKDIMKPGPKPKLVVFVEDTGVGMTVND